MDIPRNKNTEETIKEEQQKASEDLEKKDQSTDQKQKQDKQNSAKQKQKNAAQKMKQMRMRMQMQMSAGGKQQLQEDIETLRQIIDNLVVFSFDEEDLMNQFKRIEVNHNEYAKYLKKQYDLRTHFEHVDDSLFAISLRQPAFSEQINNDINDVYFHVDKALAQLSENQLYQGTASQQYALTSANNLANLLSDALDNMQMQIGMPSPGQGEGDMPLPDIIISQEELAKKMEEAMKNGEKGKAGQTGQQGIKKPGEDGQQEGEKGKNGKEGGKDGAGQGQGGSQQDDGDFNEQMNAELFKIYQEQQLLRQQLEQRLEKAGLRGNGNAKQLLNAMEDVELKLINEGFTHETLTKMMDIKHQLLKLDNATFQQGQDTKRESQTNTKTFSNSTNNQLEKAKQYFNTTEILNKQILPLQQIYKQKAQDYFKQKHD